MTDAGIHVPHDLFIDGVWRPSASGRRMDVVDPATEETVDTIPVADDADLDAALGAAQRGFEAWRRVGPWKRSAALRSVATWLGDHAETIARVLTEEQGKPLGEAAGEIRAAADQFDWYADEARRIYGRVVEARGPDASLLVTREPIGPVAAFSPWNFPLLLSARKIAPALAAGCSVIVKPAEEAPRTTMLLARACEAAALPAGAVNVVVGDPAHISARLVASDVVRKVSLTGSVPVGKLLARACAEHIKPISLELGGHSPVLVFPDADVEQAAEICARGKFRNGGQVCIAASRFFVHESVVDRFTERFVEIVRSLRVGDGREPGTDVGPLANRRRLDATESLVQEACDRGASVKSGGRRPPDRSRGYFFEPTVLDGVDDSMRLMREEPFGPIAPIAHFTSMDEVLARANATPYGLAGYVFTRDSKTAFEAAEGLEVGMVGINQLVIAAAELPFGGVKESGYGREGGAEGIGGYTITKYVSWKL